MQAKNNIQFLKKLTFLRLWNGLLVVVSYYLSKITKRSFHFGQPISISIEPTTACNLRCPECPSGMRQFSRKTGNLKTDLFEKIINQLSKRTLWLTLYFQGEPYINPDFFELIKIAHSKKIHTSTSTNAHFLNPDNAIKTVESGLDRIIISIDGTTQEVYEQYRKAGSLEKVIEGTKNLIEARKKLHSATPNIIFQFLVVKPNEHQIEEIEQLGKTIGVDEVVFKSAQVYDYKNGNPLIPENQKHSRYIQGKDGKYRLKNKLTNHCWRMWSSCVITWDGLVVPCCFDKDAVHQMGDLKTIPFQEVWTNELYQDFRGKVLISRKEIDICKNCSEGTKVWLES